MGQAKGLHRRRRRPNGVSGRLGPGGERVPQAARGAAGRYDGHPHVERTGGTPADDSVARRLGARRTAGRRRHARLSRRPRGGESDRPRVRRANRGARAPRGRRSGTSDRTRDLGGGARTGATHSRRGGRARPRRSHAGRAGAGRLRRPRKVQRHAGRADHAPPRARPVPRSIAETRPRARAPRARWRPSRRPRSSPTAT